MDKFRAIQYFMVAAEEGSLAGAARKMDVSVPAIHKLVGALEKFLGVRVFERTAKGVRLTNYGLEYLDCCRPIMAELQAAEAAMSRTSKRPSGVLIVGAHAPEQKALAPASMLGVGRAHFGLEDFQAAKATLKEVMKTFKGTPEAVAAKAEMELIAKREKALSDPTAPKDPAAPKDAIAPK